MNLAASRTCLQRDIMEVRMLTEDSLSTIRQSGAARLVVGYSGGIDSHALLHALASSAMSVPIHALHINHGISAYADAWQKHCAEVCRRLGVGYTSIRVSIQPGAAVEERARHARYAAYAGFLRPDDLLLLGHHANDQVETVLLTLFRGSNRPGLAGMPRERAIGRARLLRPLLDVERDSIESYAVQQGLCWIVDQSNEDTGMNRNYIRHRVLPVIEQRWPDLVKTLHRSLQRDMDATQLIDYIGKNDVSAISAGSGGVSIAGLSSLDRVRRRNALRYWAASIGLPIPGEAVLSTGLDAFLAASEHAAPLLTWQGVCLRRHDDHLFLTSLLGEVDATRTLSFVQGGEMNTGAGVLSTETLKGRGLAVGDLTELSIRFRHGGERIRIRHNRTLKNVFQETGMPVWLRDHVPLVYKDEELVAIAGLPRWNIRTQVASRYRATAQESGFEFSFDLPGQPYTH